MMNKPTLIAAAIAALSSAASPPVLADNIAVLEEVVVTATKRPEGLQNVPIALSVMTGDNIEQMGFKELEDMVVYMPNVHVGESGGATQIFVRGVGSGNNFGFEQSVGTFIDGVYYGRARNARAAFLDVERVEVLKGPQSTLFGKNTVGGAINITSRRPSDTVEGSIEATYETEFEGYGVTGTVSGPLNDTLRARLVAKTFEDDGWMDNSAAGGSDGPQSDNKVVRLSLEWDASDDLTVFLKAEHGEFDVTGKNHKITLSTPTSSFLFGLGGDTNFASSLGFNEKQSVSSFANRPERDENQSGIFQINLDYQMGEFSLRSISAYTEYDFSNCTDADYSSLNFIDRCRDEKHEQFTQEFLLASPTGGEFEYLAGLYYQTAKLQSDTSTMVDWTAIPPVESALLTLLGGLPPGAINTEFFNDFGQKTETWSVFTELSWNINADFTATFGLRYSADSKDADKVQITTAPGTGVSSALLAAINGPGGLGFASEYRYQESRSEQHVTGNINLQYHLNDDTMAYINFSNGYKAGGYDADNGLDRSREFEDEQVESVELGIKMEVWDNRARLNTAVFYSEFTDLQVSGFESAGFIVGNAAQSEVMGVETDFVIALSDAFTLNGALAYLDATYKDYANAACTVDQQIDGTCAANGGFQDLSDSSLQFAPDWSGNLGLAYDAPLTAQIDLLVRVDMLYTDDILIAPDGDKNVVQDAYFKYNARIALQANDGSWMLALVGKNLSDKTTFNWGNDATLAGLGFGFESAYFHMIEAPRSFELQARYNF